MQQRKTVSSQPPQQSPTSPSSSSSQQQTSFRIHDGQQNKTCAEKLSSVLDITWVYYTSLTFCVVGFFTCLYIILQETNPDFWQFGPLENRKNYIPGLSGSNSNSNFQSAFEQEGKFRSSTQKLFQLKEKIKTSQLALVATPSFEKRYLRDKTIFVSIASFRDVKCSITVEDIFLTASNPRRIFLGIIEQNEHGDPTCVPSEYSSSSSSSSGSSSDISCSDTFHSATRKYDETETDLNKLQQGQDSPERFFCPLDNVRRRRVTSLRGKGPTYGRWIASMMYRGEGYYMMIDSHNRFKPRWDTDILQMIFLADSNKPVISHYPLAWRKETNFKYPPFVTVMCRAHFVQFGYVRMGGLNFGNSKRPRKQPFTAAGFLFADAKMIHEVPFDPYLNFLFDGEELLYTVRLYTHGWDSFAPSHNIVFHDYDRHHAPRFWHIKQNKWGEGQQVSIRRVQWLLKIPKTKSKQLMVAENTKEVGVIREAEKYGLGKERTLESFWKWSRVDLWNKVDNQGVCVDFYNGKSI